MELEDMREDLEALMRHCADQKERGDITDYVFRENMAVFQNVSSVIDCMAKILEQVEHGRYADIGELISDVGKKCHERLTEHGFSGGLEQTLKRKMDKIARYLQAE